MVTPPMASTLRVCACVRTDGWIVEHDFPFTLPAFSDHSEAIFQAEASFLKAWLAHTAALEAVV